MEAHITTAIVSLGKHGDLANIAPIAKHLHDNGTTPAIVVNINYVSTLRGMTYCRPDPVHYPLGSVDLAMQYASNKYETVLCCQPYGKSYKGPRDVSYNELAWRNVGYGEHFHDTKGFPLVFDRRDKEREDFLVRQHAPGDGPLILISVGCSRSSPFATHRAFSEAIERKHGERCRILDLCAVKAARIYDLLGLFDKASLLITADTSALHLATASPSLKVMALVNDKPFIATTPRCNVVWKGRYGEVTNRMAEIHSTIRQVITEGRAQLASGWGHPH